jgi:hypothetical protein
MVKKSTYRERFQDQRLQKYVAQGYNLYQASFMVVGDCDLMDILFELDGKLDDFAFKDLLETNQDIIQDNRNHFIQAAIVHLTTKQIQKVILC